MRREMGRDLKARRKMAHMSQAELARAAGKSRSMISTVESAAGGAAGLGFWRRCDELFGTGELSPADGCRFSVRLKLTEFVRQRSGVTNLPSGPRRRACPYGPCAR